MLIVGHRGARGLAPENTLASFNAALKAGVNEIELDVRVTKDGMCVINHDPYLHDMNGVKLRAAQILHLPLKELRLHRADLVTLEQAIIFVNRRVPMVIEVKPDVQTAPVAAIIKQFLAKGWKPTDFLLASFSQRTLEQLHTALPDIEKVVNERFGGIRASWRARRVNATRIAFNHHNVWWGFIRAMHRNGYKIAVYTLNDPAKAARWERDGLYGVVTDHPERFIKG